MNNYKILQEVKLLVLMYMPWILHVIEINKYFYASPHSILMILYLLQVHVGGGSHYHVRIFRPLPGQGDLQLHSHQDNKTQEDPIEYF